jgi:hypothetical protein
LRANQDTLLVYIKPEDCDEAIIYNQLQEADVVIVSRYAFAITAAHKKNLPKVISITTVFLFQVFNHILLIL